MRLFQEANIIERHDFGDGRSRYEEATDEHHDHLIDIQSGEVIEFQNQEIEALQDEELLLGITQVAEDGWAVRLLAANPLCLRKTIRTVRAMLLDSLGRHITDLRRL